MNDSPILRLTIPMMLGMCGAFLFLPHLNATVPFVVASVLTAAMFFFLRRSQCTAHRVAFTALTWGAAFFIGMALMTRKHNAIANGMPTDTTHVCGIVDEQPQRKARSASVRIRQANGIHIILYIGQAQGDSLPNLGIGDTIIAHVKHFTPTFTKTNEATDSFAYYRKHLFRQGVCATAYVPVNQWFVSPRSFHNNHLTSLHALQEKIHSVYAVAGIDGVDGSIVEAMTIGRRTDLSRATRQHYADAGASHVLALSGYHVSIIIFVLQWLLLAKVVTLRWRWLCNLLIISVLWGYVVVAGSAPSLVRAATMCSILLACQSFAHEVISLNTVSLALTAMLCFNPMQLYDVGFQLSFVSVYGIVLFGGRMQSIVSHCHAIVRYAWGIVSVSAICFVVTAPLVAFHFGKIPLYGILTNLTITLMATALIVLSIAWWLLVGWWTSASAVIGKGLMTISHTINAVTEWVASLPFATVEWHPTLLIVALCYTAIIALAVATHSQRPA